MSVNDTLDAFLTEADAIERRLEVQWTVDDATSKGPCLCLGNDFKVVDGVGERLGADLLGAMDERDAWLVDAQSVTDIVHVVNLLTALFRGGDGNNSSIGKEQQFLVLWNLGHSDMRQDMPPADDAVLLV